MRSSLKGLGQVPVGPLPEPPALPRDDGQRRVSRGASPSLRGPRAHHPLADAGLTTRPAGKETWQCLSLAAGQVAPEGRDLPSECVMIGRPRARRSEASALGLPPTSRSADVAVVANGAFQGWSQSARTSRVSMPPKSPECRPTACGSRSSADQVSRLAANAGILCRAR